MKLHDWGKVAQKIFDKLLHTDQGKLRIFVKKYLFLLWCIQLMVTLPINKMLMNRTIEYRILSKFPVIVSFYYKNETDECNGTLKNR